MIGQNLSEIKRKSSILWSARVGRMHWRNNVVVSGESVYVSSSGSHWDAPDESDGVYCVDLHSGEQKWFFPTAHDANEITLASDVILVGTDGNEVFAISSSDGSEIARARLNSRVYASSIPIKLNNKASYHVICSFKGDVIAYSVEEKTFRLIGTIDGHFRANLTPHPEFLNQFLAVAEDGIIYKCSYDGRTFSVNILAMIPNFKAEGPYTFSHELSGVSSIIFTDKDSFIVSYSRKTSDLRPPILCFSYSSGELIWRGGVHKTVSKHKDHFGNCRNKPVLWNDLILATFSYDGSLHAFSAKTGKWIWKVSLDEGWFQNWASPIVAGSTAYVARVSGVLCIVDLKTKVITSTESLEIIERAGSKDYMYLGQQTAWPDTDLELGLPGPGPSQVLLAGISATPVYIDGRLLLGTVSGKLLCIDVGKEVS
jgi:outer membrane protein assembly factor BamB